LLVFYIKHVDPRFDTFERFSPNVLCSIASVGSKSYASFRAIQVNFYMVKSWKTARESEVEGVYFTVLLKVKIILCPVIFVF
jgi:hypothetical protein